MRKMDALVKRAYEQGSVHVSCMGGQDWIG